MGNEIKAGDTVRSFMHMTMVGTVIAIYPDGKAIIEVDGTQFMSEIHRWMLVKDR